MKWPGLKFASKNYHPTAIRCSREVAEDNAVMSNPSVDKNEMERVVLMAAKALAEMHIFVLRMLTCGKRRK